jgi:hypothetical protein
MNCHNNSEMYLDVILPTFAVQCCPVLRNSHTVLNMFENGILPLSSNSYHPPFHVSKVFNDSLIYSIAPISGSIQHSNPSSNCFTLLQHPPTLITKWQVATIPKIIAFMIHEFSLDTNPVTSSRGTNARVRTLQCDMTVQHVFSCWYD